MNGLDHHRDHLRILGVAFKSLGFFKDFFKSSHTYTQPKGLFMIRA